jgi:hypothetical protein
LFSAVIGSSVARTEKQNVAQFQPEIAQNVANNLKIISNLNM